MMKTGVFKKGRKMKSKWKKFEDIPKKKDRDRFKLQYPYYFLLRNLCPPPKGTDTESDSDSQSKLTPSSNSKSGSNALRATTPAPQAALPYDHLIRTSFSRRLTDPITRKRRRIISSAVSSSSDDNSGSEAEAASASDRDDDVLSIKSLSDHAEFWASLKNDPTSSPPVRGRLQKKIRYYAYVSPSSSASSEPEAGLDVEVGSVPETQAEPLQVSIVTAKTRHALEKLSVVPQVINDSSDVEVDIASMEELKAITSRRHPIQIGDLQRRAGSASMAKVKTDVDMHNQEEDELDDANSEAGDSVVCLSPTAYNAAPGPSKPRSSVIKNKVANADVKPSLRKMTELHGAPSTAIKIDDVTCDMEESAHTIENEGPPNVYEATSARCRPFIHSSARSEIKLAIAQRYLDDAAEDFAIQFHLKGKHYYVEPIVRAMFYGREMERIFAVLGGQCYGNWTSFTALEQEQQYVLTCSSFGRTLLEPPESELHSNDRPTGTAKCIPAVRGVAWIYGQARLLAEKRDAIYQDIRDLKNNGLPLWRSSSTTVFYVGPSIKPCLAAELEGLASRAKMKVVHTKKEYRKVLKGARNSNLPGSQTPVRWIGLRLEGISKEKIRLIAKKVPNEKILLPSELVHYLKNPLHKRKDAQRTT
ncbi:hypothetical protein I317_06422 [Kwoniella heveanensis CBS 569]|nr:hypothetical protein I317_06422 [Kwoniella heveanensis CBS 569]